MSAPVIDKAVDSAKCNGLLDILDILAYTVELFEEVEEQGATIFSRLATGGKLAHTKVESITDFSHNPFTPVKASDSVYDAVTAFITKNSHRCPIMDDQGSISSIVTQAAVINLIATHPGCLGELGKKTVKDLDLGTKPVVTVTKHTRTIDAFKIMHQTGVSGIGVVDNNDKLIGNLSARDLKAIDSSNIYSSMYVSAGAFIQKIRQESLQENHPAISCTEATTLDFVVGRLAANRIHRLYVCDANYIPIRVISLRDVLKAICKQ